MVSVFLSCVSRWSCRFYSIDANAARRVARNTRTRERKSYILILITVPPSRFLHITVDSRSIFLPFDLNSSCNRYASVDSYCFVKTVEPEPLLSPGAKSASLNPILKADRIYSTNSSSPNTSLSLN